jgi:hypothetical protein
MAPPLSTAAPHAPRTLQRLVEKCLAKAPEARWQSMRDLGDELQWAADDLGRHEEAVRVGPQRRPMTMWLLPVAAALGHAAGIWLSPAADPRPPDVVRFSVVPGERDTSGPISPEISPDGRQLAFVARSRQGTSTPFSG